MCNNCNVCLEVTTKQGYYIVLSRLLFYMVGCWRRFHIRKHKMETIKANYFIKLRVPTHGDHGWVYQGVDGIAVHPCLK